ncbi:acetyltransferase family protein, partial [Vibrio cholerae HC-71A1]|jgi:spindle assembly abnormal protein 6
LRRF